MKELIPNRTLEEWQKFFNDNFYIDSWGRMRSKKKQEDIIIIDHIDLIKHE